METPKLKEGDTALYRGDIANVWKIVKIKGEYCWAEKGGRQQQFPLAAFSCLASVTPVKKPTMKAVVPTAQKKEKKKQTAGDSVALLLAEASTVDELWILAGMCGLDVSAVKEKIAHLSNGLIRMGIGNRIRTRVNKGEFDPATIIMDGGKFRFKVEGE